MNNSGFAAHRKARGDCAARLRPHPSSALAPAGAKCYRNGTVESGLENSCLENKKLSVCCAEKTFKCDTTGHSGFIDSFMRLTASRSSGSQDPLRRKRHLRPKPNKIELGPLDFLAALTLPRNYSFAASDSLWSMFFGRTLTVSV
jgi:hypothetical protein